jgi:hypothetical protein
MIRSRLLPWQDHNGTRVTAVHGSGSVVRWRAPMCRLPLRRWTSEAAASFLIDVRWHAEKLGALDTQLVRPTAPLAQERGPDLNIFSRRPAYVLLYPIAHQEIIPILGCGPGRRPRDGDLLGAADEPRISDSCRPRRPSDARSQGPHIRQHRVQRLELGVSCAVALVVIDRRREGRRAGSRRRRGWGPRRRPSWRKCCTPV